VKKPQPLGIIVKSLDGAARASEAVLAFLLNKYKVLPDSSKFLSKKISNWNNIETGFVEVSERKILFN
jgi:L-asparaginase II